MYLFQRWERANGKVEKRKEKNKTRTINRPPLDSLSTLRRLGKEIGQRKGKEIITGQILRPNPLHITPGNGGCGFEWN